MTTTASAQTQAALDAYSATMDAHEKDLNSVDWTRTCTCGRTFDSHAGLGQHLAAIRRQADRAWNAALRATR